MSKLIKYLKPFWFPLLITVVLLFAQAQCELALPDYMSEIVDTGITKGGIQDGVVQVIRESEYQHLTLFMSEKQQALFSDNYTLIKAQEASSEQKENYPVLKKENVYELNSIDEKAREDLNAALVKAEMAVSAVRMQANDKTSELSKLMQAQGMKDPFVMLSFMPKEQLATMMSEIDKQMEAMGDTIAQASGSAYAKSEYEAVGMELEDIQNDYILHAGGKMLLVALGSAVSAILVGLFASRIGAGLSRNLRKGIFEKVESFSNEEFNRFSTSSLITRTTNDVQSVQMVIIMFLRVVIYAPIIGFGAVMHVLDNGADMTWIIALCVVILLSLIGVLMGVTMPKFKITKKLNDRINSITRGFLEGMPVIRAFNTQDYEEKSFDATNTRIMKNQLFINRMMSLMMPAMMLVMNASSLLIIWVGGHLIESGSIQVGAMMAFIQYAMQIIMAFLMIAMVAVIWPNASVSAARIVEVLDSEVKIKDPKKAKAYDPKQKGYIEFRNVSFRYPGAEEDVLHDISFTAKPGETTAFIGSTGSGKSTVVNLVPRFYDVSEGAIYIDGIDIRDVKQHDLREKIGYVPQKGILFSGDIESNLRYAKEDATAQEIAEAARIAQATEIIEAKPEKYATPISQGGTNVSGGQKQRLSIARALVKRAEIYIFDDSFSALDFKTDAKLRTELNKMIRETQATVLLVAQRISSIMHADRIVVLDKGRVAGIGTHEELMESCEVYQEIAYSQLSKEELGNE
ncbi:ABC transporter ATP-binding protein [Amedibacillus dolichus]|uniref:ABC transporter ATP-binding protein n=1 Tax=Amedibacillus dolichus TaxID=31971 RepID=UPI0026717012|nr:ABC transporter ATP-binding protein [Amedibacillus dolichus]